VTDKDRIENLEDVLAQFLKPIRNLPFPVVVKAMSDKSVLPIDLQCEQDKALIQKLVAAAEGCAKAVRSAPIIRNRPNEVGNDIEPFVIEAAVAQGLRAERPVSKGGKLRSTGYPDIMLYDTDGRPTYLECKIYGEGSAMTTMRSFYLSPSDDFKVAQDARHLLLAFAIRRVPVPNSIMSEYRPTGFKLVDLHGLLCDVKYEFNSDNRRLYADGMILAEGEV
jgi:hypothetical protein